MKTSVEIRVLQLFEQALAQRPETRLDWLSSQGEAEDVVARVLHLLKSEPAATVIMEASPMVPDEAPPEFPKVGERLGNYELLKPLEAGGMGVVYLGRRADDVYDQRVAIKLVRPVHLLATADFRRQLISRFEDERSILARMSHPNVARILDGGNTTGGIPYLVMEYVDGVSLTEYCKDNRLDVPARLRLFCKVCAGVQEAHRHLIVHRDLKPDNILVGADGEPRLLDFGIAKILEQEPLGSDKGTSLSAMTPAYASPEQVRQQALTTSSDVYSLGVVLYQLLSGARPYELRGLRPAEAERVVCETVPDPMRRMLDKATLSDAERKSRRVQITPDIERIVAKAMHKESPRRYGSAQELADDIQRYLDGQPVLAHPDSASYRFGKFMKRHRIGAVAASTALLAILLASGVALWQAAQARQAASDMAEVNDFLIDVLKFSSPYHAGGDATLSQAVDAAARQVDARFAGRPELSGPIRFALGYSMIDRNRLDLAEQQLEKARVDLTQASGPDSVAVFEAREALAQLRSAQGRQEEAEEMLQDVVSDIEDAGRTNEAIYFIALNNLGQSHLLGERYLEAERYFQRAHAVLKGGVPRATADSEGILVSNLASVAHGQGDVTKADRLFREAIAMLEKLQPDGSIEQAQAMNNHAFVLDELGKPDASFALRKASVAMRERIFGGDHPLLLTPLTDLSLELIKRDDNTAALETADRAIAMAGRLYPEGHANGVTALGMRSIALINSGRFLEAGISVGQAEAALASLSSPPDYVVDMVAGLRHGLCKRPRDPPVPSCAGIVPTEPAMP